MKKKFLLFSLSAVTLGTVLSSNSGGHAAAGSTNNRTGAKGSTANCSSGCHGTTGTTTSIIRIDSAGGVPVSKYTAGKVYTVHVVGKHSVNTRFGFQFAAVSGTGSAQVNAGTFSGLPSSVAQRTASGLSIIEQSSVISAVSPADSFVKSFTWTAPATGVGTITMYLTVNGVDGMAGASSGDGSSNVSVSLPLYTPPTTSVASVTEQTKISAFPNPVMNELNLQLDETFASSSISVFDITGRNIMNTVVAPNAAGSTTLNTSNWVPGMYKIVVANANGSNTISVVKQ
jgi:hypothetical protein